jgi:hypothetical protein
MEFNTCMGINGTCPFSLSHMLEIYRINIVRSTSWKGEGNDERAIIQAV